MEQSFFVLLHDLPIEIAGLEPRILNVKSVSIHVCSLRNID